MAVQTTIKSLAEKFTSDVLSVLRTATVEDLLGDESTTHHATNGRASNGHARPLAKAAPRAAAPGKKGRLARRGPEEIDKMVSDIASLLSKNPAGMRSEQIRVALGWQAKEMPRPLAAALASKRVVSKGQKRATTYSLKGATAGKKTVTKAAKTAGKAKSKKSSKKSSK